MFICQNDTDSNMSVGEGGMTGTGRVGMVCVCSGVRVISKYCSYYWKGIEPSLPYHFLIFLLFLIIMAIIIVRTIILLLLGKYPNI